MNAVPEVVVYTRGPRRRFGRQAKVLRDLKRRGIDVTRIDAAEDDSAALLLELHGHGVPAVFVGDMHWDGYHPAKHEQLQAALENWPPAGQPPDPPSDT